MHLTTENENDIDKSSFKCNQKRLQPTEDVAKPSFVVIVRPNQTFNVWSREKGLLQGPYKENQAPCDSKKPELSYSFQGMVFNSKIWGEGSRVCDFLLIGR